MTNIKRLATAFHESFPLKRMAIADVLRVLAVVDDPIIAQSGIKRGEVLRKNTSLGTNYVKAMPRYAQGAGLLNEEYSLSNLGRCITKNDPMLERVGTQWLIHYHMSAPHGPGPEYWHNFIISRFRVGNQFQKSDLHYELETFYTESTGKSPSNSTVKGSVNAFVNTYTDSDCLGGLRLLSEESGEFSILYADRVPAWAFAYALMDYWQVNYPDRLSINLDDLTDERGLASIFLMDSYAVNQVLIELQQAGVVEVYRSAPPYQLLLLSRDQELALQNLYGTF